MRIPSDPDPQPRDDPVSAPIQERYKFINSNVNILAKNVKYSNNGPTVRLFIFKVVELQTNLLSRPLSSLIPVRRWRRFRSPD
jgi:hypothetical protein